MITKLIQQSIANVIKTYGFTGDIKVKILYEDIIKHNYGIGVYYFEHEDELYHIIAVYADNVLRISLNNEIAKAIVEEHIK